LEFFTESFFDSIEEAKPLMLAHVAEVGRFPPEKFSLYYDIYAAVEKAGLLRCFSVREGNKLVGYATFFITPHVHFSGVIVAIQDSLFIDPTYRGQASVEFLDWCDQQLRADGADAISRHVTIRKDYGKLLKRLGYEPWETNYIRDFKEVH